MAKPDRPKGPTLPGQTTRREAVVVTVPPVGLVPHRPEYDGPDPFETIPTGRGPVPAERRTDPEWPRRDELMDRVERAVEVRDTYRVEQVGPMSWVVTHPTEPERCYVVDAGQRTCTCPDYGTRGLGVCKHLVALADKFGIEIDWESELL